MLILKIWCSLNQITGMLEACCQILWKRPWRMVNEYFEFVLSLIWWDKIFSITALGKDNETRRACASMRSCKIWVGVIIIIVVIITGGKHSPILLHRLRSKSYFVGFVQKERLSSLVFISFNHFHLVNQVASAMMINLLFWCLNHLSLFIWA